MTLWPAIGGVLHCIYTASAGPLSHHHIFCLLSERRSDASTFIFQHSWIHHLVDSISVSTTSTRFALCSALESEVKRRSFVEGHSSASKGLLLPLDADLEPLLLQVPAKQGHDVCSLVSLELSARHQPEPRRVYYSDQKVVSIIPLDHLLWFLLLLLSCNFLLYFCYLIKSNIKL
jgi:hypothetical protein